jgi:tetratricopeptide (TPR) repeat protein
MRRCLHVAMLVFVSLSAFGGEPTPPQPALSTSAPDPDSTPAYLIDLANVHLKYNSVPRARAFLRKALELSKDAAQRDSVLQSVKPVFQRTNDWKQAIETYQDFLTVSLNASERGKINLALADAHLKNGEPDKAEAILTDIAKPDKERPDDQQQRQNALQALLLLWQSNPARVDPAIAAAEARLAKDASDSAALDLLLQIYSFIRHDAPKQIETAEKLAALRPDDSGEQRRLAGLYQQSRQYDKAIAVNTRLMNAAQKNDEHQQYARAVGELLVQAGKKDEALVWMLENFDKHIQRSGDYMVLATFYENQNMLDLAEYAIKRWVNNAATPEEKIEALFRVAQLALKQKDYAKAEESLHTLAADYKDRQIVMTRVNALWQKVEAEKKKAAEPKPQPKIELPVGARNGEER